jgi:hypothetical protein
VCIAVRRVDDDIYSSFRQTFPDISVARIDEDAMKSVEGKELWRPLLMSFEHNVEDFNYLTLLRIDASGDYSEANTTVGMLSSPSCLRSTELAAVADMIDELL